MPIFQDLKQFVRSENEYNRYEAIEKLAKNSQSWQGNLLIWQIMALIPTNEEKSKLAESLILPNYPSSEWAIISYLLLKETNDSVLSSCINNLGRSKICAFSNRISKFFDKSFLTNKILYSIYSYAEQTGDENLSDKLENSFHKNLPDNLLSKGFHVFIKLGIISDKIKNIAFNIISSDLSDDLDKTSMISALFYLAFSMDKNDINHFKNLKNNLKNIESFRLSEIILSQILKYEKLNFNELAAENFIKNSLYEEKPNFIGYNCFDNQILIKITESLIQQSIEFNFSEELTSSILKLKNLGCIDILSKNKSIGISAIEKDKKYLEKIWITNIPYKNELFIKSVINPEHFKIWHKNSTDISFIFLNYDILFESKTNLWQDFFDQCYDTKILLSQIVALANLNTEEQDLKKYLQIENKVIQNIKKCVLRFQNNDSKSYEDFVEKIYSATIGCNISPNFMREIYKTIPFSGTSWAFTAIALSAPRLDLHTISLAIQSELETIHQTLIKGNMEKDEYILEVTSRFQSILVGSNRFRIPITQKTLSTLKDISNLIQNILDNTSQNEDETELESSDWSGNFLTDRPILRWGAILQVCLNSHLTMEEKDYYERYIREGLRVAPHVEKRWIVRALVKLDTDDAIKAILYQALQHIDPEFVEHTINELLNSKHKRAHQALIRSISKNNISNELKIKIIKEISLENPEEILQELKTLQLLRLHEDVDYALQEAIQKISKLIPVLPKKENDKDVKISSQDIDLIIKSLIPLSDFLSIDSKSALRTAEMILIQSKDWGNEAVDLSPIVNMHCKAVELTMRDTFEAYTDSVIRKGELSKKLEFLGYGKGLVEKMTLFEDYIANLPTIRSIPYFSKFKLRKMLRAICLYRPGKRFTLDGPKAFALLLLVAAREECQFNLNKMLQIHFTNDLELYEFIKLVHSLQDSRNRAVHEGLTWEARDEIETMRKQAYKIISICLTIGRNLETQISKKGDSPLENH
ncbi:MAG: hypothetical protein K2X69_02055 [Silvanigrellaceae bacterium]|jgi:hypothetical protein|nr:hypothetical protein [Silvanigrellaceae bacterium]